MADLMAGRSFKTGRRFLWTAVKSRRTRNSPTKLCERCGNLIRPGDRCFKAITNTHERTERYCPACAELLFQGMTESV